MSKVISTNREQSLGSVAKKIRLLLGLTRKRIADLTGVSVDEVKLFEQNLPVQLDVRRRLIKELIARKINGSTLRN